MSTTKGPYVCLIPDREILVPITRLAVGPSCKGAKS